MYLYQKLLLRAEQRQSLSDRMGCRKALEGPTMFSPGLSEVCIKLQASEILSGEITFHSAAFFPWPYP